MNINEGVYIVTANADGKLYIINGSLREIVSDWNGDCNMVPCNDAKVYFAAFDGEAINPYLYTNFESLLQLLLERDLKKRTDGDVSNEPVWGHTEPEWEKFNRKWGTNDREGLTPEQEHEYLRDLYDAYEASGFVPFFQRTNHPYNGKKFTVTGRISLDDSDWDLECLPAWGIKFEDGAEIPAFPEEICFAEIFPFANADLLPVLGEILVDDGSFSGESIWKGKTVMDFLQNDDIKCLRELNDELKRIGIKPVGTTKNPELSFYNTLIHYIYRDGENYKLGIDEVLVGDLTDEQFKRIETLMPDGIYFYPADYGLCADTFADRGYKKNECDIDEHEFRYAERTTQAPTTPLTAQNFLEMIEREYGFHDN